MGDLGGTYHIHTPLWLGRELDHAALRRALDAIIARHEALRTTFVEMDGEPCGFTPCTVETIPAALRVIV